MNGYSQKDVYPFVYGTNGNAGQLQISIGGRIGWLILIALLVLIFG